MIIGGADAPTSIVLIGNSIYIIIGIIALIAIFVLSRKKR